MTHQGESANRIFMIEENVPGVLLARHAFVSDVQYTAGGIEHNVQVLNEEYFFTDQNEYEGEYAL